MKYDGVFVVCADYHEDELRELLASNIPIVVVDHTLKRHVNVASNQYGDMRRLMQFVFDTPFYRKKGEKLCYQKNPRHM